MTPPPARVADGRDRRRRRRRPPGRGARRRRPPSGRSPASGADCGRLWPFLGPAFIAAVAYVDPGNFATNIAAGAKYGYLLLWVILAANLMAMLIQTMSAKLGIATGMNLAEVCREQFPSRSRSACGCRPR